MFDPSKIQHVSVVQHRFKLDPFAPDVGRLDAYLILICAKVIDTKKEI